MLLSALLCALCYSPVPWLGSAVGHMQSPSGWIIRVRDLGVADQDIETVRRLRTINILVVLSVGFMSSYGTFYAAYDAFHFANEILFLAMMALLILSVLLATKDDRVDLAAWLMIFYGLCLIAVISWLLGPAGGTLTYLIAAPFVFSLILPMRHQHLIWPIAFVVGAIFFIEIFSGRQGSVGALPQMVQRIFFFASVVGAIVLACAVSLVYRWLIEHAEAELSAEKARSDRLLRAILPDSIATQLKADDSQVIAQRYDAATAVFADIVGFTKRSAEGDAEPVVIALNRIFSAIDELASARKIEKIKTIGDAYFAVCGLPEPVHDHVARVADFAIDLQSSVHRKASTVWPELKFRIVIHTGPVVAGVIGRTKFAYDVWGDTINTAARLEEVCSPGETLLTDAVAKALPDRFQIKPLGKIDVRDKGPLQIYRLVGSR